MKTRSVFFEAFVLSAFALAALACSGASQNGQTDVAVSGDSSAPTGVGVDMESLVPRERRELEQLLQTTLAPCSDQAVPLDVCLKERRSCSGCGPASRFLADRVKAGLPRGSIQRAYGLRFGGDVRQVDVADSPAKGPANAPVTIMIWSDFECPACRRIVPLVEEAFSDHDKEVRLVHKLYPLSKHPHGEIAARAAYAAKLQGRYWEMEKALFEQQPKLSEATIRAIAEDLGLDMAKFEADAASPNAKKVIDRDMNDADRSGLMGTPFILINGREFDLELFRPDVDLEPWIQMELELARSQRR